MKSLSMDAQKTQSRHSGMRLRLGERRSIMFLGDFVIAWGALFLAIYLWAISDVSTVGLFEFLQLRLRTWFFLLPFLDAAAGR